jgi:hypothetical protein
MTLGNKSASRQIYKTKDGREYYRINGRFAGWVKGKEKPKSLKLLGFGNKGHANPKDLDKLVNLVNQVNKYTDSKSRANPKIQVCKDWGCVKKSTGISDRNFLGAYQVDKGTITVTPTGLQNPKTLQRVMIHETYHARKRSKGFINNKAIKYYSKNPLKDLKNGGNAADLDWLYSGSRKLEEPPDEVEDQFAKNEYIIWTQLRKHVQINKNKDTSNARKEDNQTSQSVS